MKGGSCTVQYMYIHVFQVQKWFHRRGRTGGVVGTSCAHSIVIPQDGMRTFCMVTCGTCKQDDLGRVADEPAPALRTALWAWAKATA